METTTPPAPVTPPPATTEDKTVAIVSYLTLLGFIVAIVLHSSKKTKLGAFHLRQSLGLILTSIAGYICVAIMMFLMFLVLAFMKSFLLLLVPLIWLAFLGSVIALWVMGFIAAINGQMKPMPIVGPLYQKWFGTAFEQIPERDWGRRSCRSGCSQPWPELIPFGLRAKAAVNAPTRLAEV